jgi:lipopolysaccharide/colanic/teichoic acid biosynthesis glycosyltransferase
LGTICRIFNLWNYKKIAEKAGCKMKKQRKIVIAVSGLIIAVIIVFIIQNIVNTPKGGVCIEEGRIVNGSAPFTSLEVKDAMSELKSIFEKSYAGCSISDMWYTQTGGENYKNASDSKITLHTKIITGNKKIGKMNRNATYNDWKWIFQKKDENGKWQLISDGYTP